MNSIILNSTGTTNFLWQSKKDGVKVLSDTAFEPFVFEKDAHLFILW